MKPGDKLTWGSDPDSTYIVDEVGQDGYPTKCHRLEAINGPRAAITHRGPIPKNRHDRRAEAARERRR